MNVRETGSGYGGARAEWPAGVRPCAGHDHRDAYRDRREPSFDEHLAATNESGRRASERAEGLRPAFSDHLAAVNRVDRFERGAGLTAAQETTRSRGKSGAPALAMAIGEVPRSPMVPAAAPARALAYLASPRLGRVLDIMG